MLESATAEIERICREAVLHVVREKRAKDIGIPEAFIPYVMNSYDARETSIYGRFDLVFDGKDHPKLLEYNADTPTALLEASVVQWHWMKDRAADADQFNSIHEKLIAAWKKTGIRSMHFSCIRDHDEDLGNTEYIRDTAAQAGIETKHVFVEDIGWDSRQKKFIDKDGAVIQTMFKLYPWEWLFADSFGPHIAESGVRFIEPAWKLMLSNKGILPILWELFPGHPNLLPAYFDNRFSDNYVRKPFLSREGSNVSIVRNGTVQEKGGTYGAEGYIYQEHMPVPSFDGNYTTIGSWVIGGEPAGIGIREDTTEITMNSSRFIPHYFKE